jgi:hypothetical protein
LYFVRASLFVERRIGGGFVDCSPGSRFAVRGSR